MEKLNVSTMSWLRAVGKLRTGGVAAAALSLSLGLPALALEPPAGPAAAAAALQAKRTELQPQLRANVLGEPLYLSSREGPSHVEGDVYAEVGYPLANVSLAFRSASSVCELLFLHLNVRACRPSSTANGGMLALTVGPKRGQAPGAWYSMDYTLHLEANTPTYLRATLSAEQGPLSTHDYRIIVEAVPVNDGRSFVHIGYAYDYGFLARTAMKIYLATAGRAKIGFTVVGQSADGRPIYIRGERAALERNIMRYYLALLAYCSVTKGSPQEQTEARLNAWFKYTERYPAQLHELDLAEYVSQKHDDLALTEANAP